MTKPRKVWMPAPAKSPRSAVPISLKAELERKAARLIEDVLKPKHVRPPEPDSTLNYITDITSKWRGKFFYFVATYTCPDPRAISPTFESKFARMDFVGYDSFALCFQRHTGEWIRLFGPLSVDECLQAIRDDPWFVP